MRIGQLCVLSYKRLDTEFYLSPNMRNTKIPPIPLSSFIVYFGEKDGFLRLLNGDRICYVEDWKVGLIPLFPKEETP